MKTKWRNGTLSLQIPPPLLEGACQKISELLLLCLPQANSVTPFLVGSVPHLRITCLGTAAKNREKNKIQWHRSTPIHSDLSGKTWKDIRDYSSDDLRALYSCIRKQTGLTTVTSAAPLDKGVLRSCAKGLKAHFILEPVLMEKADLWPSMPPSSVYPKDRDGKPLWLESDHVMVALIEIILSSEATSPDPNCWQITEELARALAMQLLHLHSHQSLGKKIEVVAEERDEIRQILITQIRKIMSKLGMIYRVIDNEVASLRQSWEDLIHQYHPEQPYKSKIVEQLNLLLQNLDTDLDTHSAGETRKQIEWYQNKLAEFCFLPEENEVWFQQKIVPLWTSAASRLNSAPHVKKQIKKLLDGLEQSFYVGLDETLFDKIDHIPNSVKSRWIRLIYNEKDWTKIDLLNEYIHLLEELHISLPNKRKTLENLICLKNLALTIEDLEEKLTTYYQQNEEKAQIYKKQLH
jgi:hypothetical protein